MNAESVAAPAVRVSPAGSAQGLCPMFRVPVWDRVTRLAAVRAVVRVTQFLGGSVLYFWLLCL